MIKYLQWLSSGLSISGMFLVVQKYRAGWLVWIAASFCWLYVFYVSGLFPRMVVELIYAIQAGYGFWKWRKKDGTKN